MALFLKGAWPTISTLMNDYKRMFVFHTDFESSTRTNVTVVSA